MFHFSADHAQHLFAAPYAHMLRHLAQQQVIERLWARDPSLWHPSAETQRHIAAQLGWLDLPPTIAANAASVAALLRDFRAAGLEQVAIVAPNAAGHIARLWSGPADRASPPVRVLDTLEPATVAATLAAHDWARTALVLPGDAPTLAQRTLLQAIAAVAPRARCAVFAPPDAPSATYQAPRPGWRMQHVPVPAKIGLRWGALAPYGLLPAALAGLDLHEIRAAALDMAQACRAPDPARNPGLQLGTLLGVAAQAGRDKLTIVAPPELGAVAEWIAAFVAGSLSKHGRGFVPIVGEPLDMPAAYRRDRLFVVLHTPAQPDFVQPQLAALEEAQQPSLVCSIGRREDVAALALCWQVAVAIAATILGVNPFDEPDTVLFERQLARRVATAPPQAVAAPPDLDAAQFRAAIPALRRASWIALAAYVPVQGDVAASVAALRALLRARCGSATILIEPLQAAYAVQLLHAGRRDGAIIALSGRQAREEFSDDVGSVATLAQARYQLDRSAWQRMGRVVAPLEAGQAVADDLRRWYAWFDRWL